MKRLKLYLLPVLCFFLTGLTGLWGQIKVVPDNYFVQPGSRRTLDVMKNDNPGNCASTPEDLVLEILSPSPMPSTLQNLEVTSDNKILFRSKSDFHGQIKISYKITCQNGGASSTGDAYVNVGSRPDFINDAECTVESLPFVWDVEKKGQTDENVHWYAVPLVGDLDADGNLEIVTVDEGRFSNNLLVFNSDLSLKNKIAFPFQIESYPLIPVAIGDVNGDGLGEIIVAMGYRGDYKLRAYSEDGTIVWESTDPYILNGAPAPPTGAAGQHVPSVTLADIDGDGLVEILACDRIFAGESGKLLATLPETENSVKLGRSYKNLFGSESYWSVLADVTGDGKLNVVAGNTTYDVVINSRVNPDLNSVTVLATLAGSQPDGITSVADIDGDGILDVVVTASVSSGLQTIYVWQGSAAQLIGNPIVKNQSGISISRAFLGDITGNGKADIAFTAYCVFEAYEYNSNTNSFNLLFSVPTSDTSGATTMSMFDFNLDGEVELVYRDETLLRIIDKNGNNVKDKDDNEAVFSCLSGTATEYPVIADLDGDGHAEIIVSGRDPNNEPAKIRIMVFGSKTPGTWAPARRVWNQHGYNPLYINEDLSVPEKPLSPTTKIAHKDGSVHSPFNSYLQQSGVLNTEGESLNLSPDLGFQVGRNQKMYHDTNTDELQVTAYVTNSGSMDFNGDIKLSLYLYDKTAGTYQLKGFEVFTNQTLAQRGNQTLVFRVANYSSITFPSEYLWYVVINLDDNGISAPTGAYNDQRECNYWNNMTSRMSYISGQVILCQGESATLNIEPAGAFDCYWFNPDGSPYPSSGTNKGDSKTVTKQTGDYKEYFLIDVYQKNTLSKVTAAPDTVFIYNSPDSLIWTGAYDSDWNNILNWSDPNDPSQEKLFSYIPRSCTNVHIPDQLTIYPDLSSASTKYDVYSNSACNNITFEHGGEVLNSDQLSYSKAYVQIELMSNRWYCFSPPLRDLYSGDIYLTDKNPYDDNMFAYTRKFMQASKPGYIEGYWGSTFNTPNVILGSGTGLGVWIDDLDPDPNNHQGMLFRFPKNDTEHYLYDDDGSIQVEVGPFPTSRTNSHRLIFEETFNSGTKEVALLPSSTQSGLDILIGNPFMTHWDFKKFYNYGNNKNLIEDHYRIMDSNGSYSTYSISGVSTGNPVLTNLVAPMQAILVTPKSSFSGSSLVTHPSHTQTSAGNKLRSALSEDQEQEEFIWISLSDAEVRNRCALVYSPGKGISLSYNEGSDIYKVLRMGDKNPNIYIRTSEGYYMDIKKISDLEEANISIGLCGEFSGSMSLGFEKLWSFATDYTVYLYDKVTGKEQNLRKSSIYTFTASNGSESFIDDRFVLRFVRNTTSITGTESSSLNIGYRQQGSEIEVYSKDGELLEDIEVYDLQGRKITNHSQIGSSRCIFNLDKGIYILRVKTSDTIKSLKVLVS